MEDKIAYLFQPDVLVTESMRRKVLFEPEQRLMLAVLEDAVACFQKYAFSQDGEEESLFRDAEEWIQEKDASSLFSFENICDFLELNPEYLRKGLWRWRERAKENVFVIPMNHEGINHIKVAL